VVDGKPLPVCDYAGFAPFGFGYRRCPGEQLTIQVFEDFLRKVWRDKIAFRSLNLANPRRCPSVRTPSSTTTSPSPGHPDR
jgi:cytochrome P450